MTNIKQYEALSQEVLDIVTGLLEVIADLISSEQVQHALSQYRDHVDKISQSAEKFELSGVNAVCLTLNEKIQDFCSEQRALTEAEQDLFALWPVLLLGHIDVPEAIDPLTELIDLLEQSAWINPLTADEAEIITMLLVEDMTLTENKNENENENENNIEVEAEAEAAAAAASNIQEPPDNMIETAALDMVSALLDIIPELTNEQTFLNSLSIYNDSLQSFIDVAEQENLLGIQSVTMTIYDDLKRFITLHRPLTENEQSLLELWPALLIEYLEKPEDVDLVLGLLEYLQRPEWVNPLSAEDAEMLVTLLMPENITNDDAVLIDEILLVIDLAEVPEVNEANGEMVSMLRVELDSLQSIWAELLEQACDTSDDFDVALETYAEQLERLASAAEVVSLIGLQHYLAYLHALVTGFRMLSRALNKDEKELLNSWPTLFAAYLDQINDKETVHHLIAVLRNDIWQPPVDEETSASIITLLSTISLTQELIDEDAEPRQTTATQADVSLSLPEDVNPELLEGMLTELPSQTAEFSEAIQKLLIGQGGEADVEVAQRIAHTLKGAANTVGIIGIANLTHHIEDILLAFSKHQALPTGKIASTLVNASDMLEGMSESLLGIGDAPPEKERLETLQTVLDWANQIDKKGIEDIHLKESSDSKEQTLEEDNAPSTTTTNTTKTTKTANKVEQTVTTLRVDAPIIDNLLRLSGESMILNGQLQEKLDDILNQTRNAHKQNKVLLQLTTELEHLIDVQDVFNIQHKSSQDENFDPLEFDHYNELHTYVRRLIEAATDTGFSNQVTDDELKKLESMMVNQARLNRENQDSVLKTRMVAVSSIVPRLQRGVRQTCRLTEKQVDLTVVGEETLVDSDILSSLVDPLMHILRNAIDHGIEADEHRELLEKPAQGNISLSFALEGDQIAVRCHDDGAGIDTAGIRYKAIELGLIAADTSMSVHELQRLIFMPGFSIKDSASQTSGRGVGMDAVYTKIQSLKGSIDISSEIDVGTNIDIFLPLTMLSAHALLVRSHRQIFAIVNRGIEQILYAGSGELVKTDDQWRYIINDEELIAKPFEQLINVPIAERRAIERQDRPLLLVRGEGSKSVILVEEVIDSRDIVVKPMGIYIPDIRGIMGATILGDGSVATVLDLPELLRAPREIEISDTMSAIHGTDYLGQALPYALVIDDSLSARRSLEQFVEDLGYECRAARDGLEAVDILGNKIPDIILVDLEMPRMNGLEFTLHVRSQESTKDIPIIMITSRSTAKTRQQAEESGVDIYLTKPFSEEVLTEHIHTLLASEGR